MKRINVVTGHYGTGKTNFSVNLALWLAGEGKKVTVVDLDVVNPYFRTSDFSELFKKSEIELVSPMYANTNLDIPAISFDLDRLAYDDGYLIVDVGGDDAGATALGRYYDTFSQLSHDVEMIYVINCNRLMTKDSYETVEVMKEIEKAARLRHTAIVNNSNLGSLTTAQTITESIPYAKEVSDLSGLPLLFTTVPNNIYSEQFADNASYKEIDIFVKPLWDFN